MTGRTQLSGGKSRYSSSIGKRLNDHALRLGVPLLRFSPEPQLPVDDLEAADASAFFARLDANREDIAEIDPARSKSGENMVL
jgi:hypothetical protein